MVSRTVSRVDVTPEATALLHQLQAQHGELVFHQSEGCCDGSSPMCFPRSEFRIGAGDVYLSTIADVPFYIGAQQFQYWQHTHLTIDVVPGRGEGFSLAAPVGLRFLTRSRFFDDDEYAALVIAAPPPSGDQHESNDARLK